MKYVNYSIGALCVIITLLSTTCSKPEFDNPLDPKGNNYLYGDTSDEECKTSSQGSGSGLFGNRCARYTLITNASPPSGGNVSRSINASDYLSDTRVTLTATPAQGYVFAGWIDAPSAVNASSPEITFNITGNVTITANFAPDARTLATGISPQGSGSVQRIPDLESYAYGTQINVTATPEAGYVFKEWTGAPTSVNASSPSISFNITANVTLTAIFEQAIYTHTLTTNANPQAGGTVSPAGTTERAAGIQITVAATPAPGYEFDGWTGAPGVVNPMNTAITFEMNDNVTLIANFRQINTGPTPITYTLSTSASPAVGGFTSRSPSLTNYEAGTPVTVTATPNAGYVFTGWTGGLTSAAQNMTFNINSNITLVANFELQQIQPTTYTLTVNAGTGGTVNPSGTSTHNAGAWVDVYAYPTNGYAFTGWSDGVTSASRTVIMSSNVTLTANFLLIPTGSFTDSRDGKTYRTVVIVNREWMAENLNYETADSWCYDDNTSNCDTYGRLYTWSAAMDISSSFNSALWDGSDVDHQGVCPAGWRVPNDADWDDLVSVAGGESTAGSRLKSQTGWRSHSGISSTDEFGFSAQPGGFRFNTYNSDGNFSDDGYGGYWWSAMEVEERYLVGYEAWHREMVYYKGDVARGEWLKDYALAVRCVMDD